MFGRVNRVEGLRELMTDIKKLERMPQSQIAKGVRRGANVILREARSRAPKGKTGKLRKNLTLKPERGKRGKKVLQVTFRKVEKFPEAVKVTKEGTRYYYPASQEWGFTTRDGGRFEKNKHFLVGAMESKKKEAAKVIVDEVGKEIEKGLREGRIR